MLLNSLHGKVFPEIAGKNTTNPKGTYVTDTEISSAEKFNMYVHNGITLNVDETQAKNFPHYESFIVARLLSNLVTGFGPQNYNFPTNGEISRKFMNSTPF